MDSLGSWDIVSKRESKKSRNYSRMSSFICNSASRCIVTNNWSFRLLWVLEVWMKVESKSELFLWLSQFSFFLCGCVTTFRWHLGVMWDYSTLRCCVCRLLIDDVGMRRPASCVCALVCSAHSQEHKICAASSIHETFSETKSNERVFLMIIDSVRFVYRRWVIAKLTEVRKIVSRHCIFPHEEQKRREEEREERQRVIKMETSYSGADCWRCHDEGRGRDEEMWKFSFYQKDVEWLSSLRKLRFISKLVL